MANHEEEPLQHIAVAAHPGGRTKTVIGEVASGPAIVQIWSAPYATEAKASSTGNALPQMQLGICHEGGLTWDCKWCPSDTSIQHMAGTDALSRWGFASQGKRLRGLEHQARAPCIIPLLLLSSPLLLSSSHVCMLCYLMETDKQGSPEKCCSILPIICPYDDTCEASRLSRLN